MTRRPDRFLVGIAALILSSGLWGLLLPWPSPLEERRAPAAWPGAPRGWAQACAWPRRFDQAWGDRFPWRWAWIALDANWRYRLLGAGRPPFLPGQRGIAVGRGGTLFYDAEGSFEAVTGRWTLDPAAAEDWLGFARAKAALARRHNAVLVLALVPDKAQIYAEHRPPLWEQHGPGALAQVQAVLGRDEDWLTVDLRPALLKAKAQGLAYHRYDGHWTYEGAAHAWEALLQAARARWPSHPLPPLRPAESWDWQPAAHPTLGQHGLSDLLGLWPPLAEPGRRIPRAPQAYFSDWARQRPHRWDGPNDRGAPWLLYHDSFGAYFRVFMRLEGWGGLFWPHSWSQPEHRLDEAVMARIRPKLVLVQIAERALPLGPPR
jgi:hypothetical protein